MGYSIYKGKAALTVEPRAPEFTPLDVKLKYCAENSAISFFWKRIKIFMGLVFVQSGAYKVSKEGFVLLQFAPAAAARQYDWSRKQVFWIFF